MRNITFFLAALLLIWSCTKDTTVATDQNLSGVKPSELTITLNSAYNTTGNIQTRASGANHGNQTKDATLNTLEILIFNNQASNTAKQLEVYKQYTSTQIKEAASNFTISATTGEKIIYVIANSHATGQLSKIKSHADFCKVQSSLLNEDAMDFCMTFKKETTLTEKTDLSVTLERLVSRIQLKKLETNFAGTPYEGCSLSNIKVYITNVNGSKNLYDGADPATGATVFNKGQLLTSGYAAARMTGLLNETLSAPLAPGESAGSVYFYGYENTISSETSAAKFTRLVIECTLNNVKYYYPININRSGYGYVSLSSHKGIKRNSAYSITCTITGPGSDNPDKPLTQSSLTSAITVSEWDTVADQEISF